VTSVTNPAGGVSTNQYDPAGRLIKQINAAGEVTAFTYDTAGQLIKKTDPLGGVTKYGYDLAGNRISVTDPNGHTSTTSYNAMNEPVGRTNAMGHTWTMVRDAGGLITDEADPLGHHTSHVFDAIGNQTSTTDALGRTSLFGYDLNQRRVTTTATDGIVTANEYDPVGNLVTVIRNRRGGEPVSTTVNVTTRYTYDSRNLLISTTDANGAVSGRGYNSRRLPTSLTNPLGKVTSYGYDPAGNRTSRADANGKTTDYDFDARDLLVRRTYADGSEETFTYDAVGRQLTAANGAGTVSTTYDALGRTTKVTDAAANALSSSYDPAGNRTGLTLPDGRKLTYTFDAANQVTKLITPLGEVNFTYDAAGRSTAVQRPNGTLTAVTYDNADELTRLLTTAGSTQLASFAYTYDNVGNVASRAQNLDGTSSTATYSYDPLRRLTASNGGTLPSTYTYDAVGNRLTWSAPDDPTTPKPSDQFTQTNTFNAAGQLTKSTKVRQNGGATFTDVTTNTFDDNGNRIATSTDAQAPGQSAATGYSYDFENRLARSAPTGDRSARGNGNDQRVDVRTYDALGRLVTDTRGTTTTNWTSDGLNPIVGKDTATTLYLRDLAGDLLGERTDTSDPDWYVTDALGSILGATNAKAKLTNVTSYSDYGVNLGTSNFRVGFGGELADPIKPGNGVGNDSPALSHYYARSYDPVVGVWQQVDPMADQVGKPATLGKYQFAGDNPTSNTDLLGYWSLSVASPTTSPTLTIGSSKTSTVTLSVAPPPTYSGNLSTGLTTSSWNGLQGFGGSAQLLQPGATDAASLLQPTISAYQLQPAAGWDLLSGACRRKRYACSITVQPNGGTTGESLLAGMSWDGGSFQGSSLLLQGPGALQGVISVSGSTPGVPCKDYSDSLIHDFLLGRATICHFPYNPIITDNGYGTRAFDPNGACSVIDGTAYAVRIDDACKTHDYGYDILRYRKQIGYPGAPDYVRIQVDNQLSQDIMAICNGDSGCLRRAGIVSGAVKTGSWFTRIGPGYPGGKIDQ
jgi:RHS repeat-associated protein